MASKTFLIIPQEGHGHLNACQSVASQLAELGHRVIVAFEQAWRPVAEKLDGRLSFVFYVDPTRPPNLAPNEFWLDHMERSCNTFGLDPMEEMDMEKVEDPNQDPYASSLYSMLNIDKAVGEVIAQVQPDVIVLDTYKIMPAVVNCGRPWVWLTSAGPLSCLGSPLLPPSGTGYPTFGDRHRWQEYRNKSRDKSRAALERYQRRVVEVGGPQLPAGERMLPSPFLNIYAYPRELDYLDIRPLPDATWARFDHFIRTPSTNIDHRSKAMPISEFQQSSGALVYVSMGTLGCADRTLMARLVELLANRPERFLMSLGPKAKDLATSLPANIVGREWLDQMTILPMVDLVITHAGNNTVCEALYHGKPLLATPLFGDQMDNAQRLVETGFGRRLNPYRCTRDELGEAIAALLNDQQLAERLKKISERMQNSQSTLQAARAIEQLASKCSGEQ